MYLNLVQIAESFGVSEQVVIEWVRKEGMPHVHDRDRILFEQAQVMTWAARNGLAAHAGFLAPPEPSLASALDLAALLRRGGIRRDIAPANLGAVLADIVSSLPNLNPAACDMLTRRIGTPGGLTMAPTGAGFALPHLAKGVFLGESCALVALILLDAPWPGAETPDGMPVTRLLFFISPTPRLHVNMLGLLARSIAAGKLGRAIDEGADDAALLQALVEGSAEPIPSRSGGTR
jgi:PTS system nitrogen regulatory IIA component